MKNRIKNILIAVIGVFLLLINEAGVKTFALGESAQKKTGQVEREMTVEDNFLNAEKYDDVEDLIEAERFREAGEVCRKRISSNPADYVALTQLGRIYLEEQKYKKAIKFFKRAIKIAPDYPMARFCLGKAYVLKKEPEKGLLELDIFEEKMDLLSKMDEDTVDFYVETLQYMCYIFSTVKRYDEVIERSKKIAKLRPNDQRAHYNLAVCYYNYRHNRSRAYNELQKVIGIDPDTRIAAKAEYFIDYMRRNPDSRIIGDFSFIDEE
ncbi:MAG: tetratricopeptide repeat protein [Candidatus Omnitrophica bacterium]|nr:tetratricopeptide repeat protein [Candidatus Omnitrophota bacterium]